MAILSPKKTVALPVAPKPPAPPKPPVVVKPTVAPVVPAVRAGKPVATKPTTTKPTTTKPKPTGTKPKPTGAKPTGAPATGGTPDAGNQVDNGAVNDTTSTDATAAQTGANLTNAAMGKVSEQDPLLQQQYTQGIGELGFGYGGANGGLANFNDIFGTFAPGGAANTAGRTIKDALGRDVSTANAAALLGSDVYDQGGAAQNIAGTTLGDLILSSRKNAAADAEARSAGGLSTAGGIRNAAGEAQRIGNEQGITSLLSGLTGLTSDISGKRQTAYTDAMGNIGSSDIAGYVPPAAGNAPSPAAAAATSPEATGNKKQLTAGPSGTFRTATGKILSSGTPAQKIGKLTAILNSTNLTPVQKKTVQQMITTQKKKK